jgi:hypothetical protein
MYVYMNVRMYVCMTRGRGAATAATELQQEEEGDARALQMEAKVLQFTCFTSALLVQRYAAHGARAGALQQEEEQKAAAGLEVEVLQLQQSCNKRRSSRQQRS